MLTHHILHVIDYFAVFQYPPTLDEIHTFLTETVSREKLQQQVQDMIQQGTLQSKRIQIDGASSVRYTRGEYRKYFNIYKERVGITAKKMDKAWRFIQTVSQFPQIRFIGLSGSMSMWNAKHHDDIDLFVITGKGRLWTARIICLTIGEWMGVRRRRHTRHTSDKICLNLFFDEQDLTVPHIKKNEYVAHELLQLRPLVDKDSLYEQLLERNAWIYTLLPNAPRIQGGDGGEVEDNEFSVFERIFGIVQRISIGRHRTREIITNTQLWFFPDDFEPKLRHHIPIADSRKE